ELAEGESVLLAIDRSLIEASLGVATLELDPDGFAYVDDARNADRLAMLRDGMASAITLRRDGDGSGSLDTEELRAAPIARAP
ncbi:MAG: hypothetical protein H6719_35290, partial [Sandaracinaceae bacterium]|nr:hypothetical protein [Sandaracinaceae bacterium]